MCLRGKLADAGVLPAPEPMVAATDPAAATAEPETALAEPELDVTPAEPETPSPQVPEDLVAATFGLLRAEPDGSLVIAGSGTPGSEVEVYSNDSLIGTATVESSGDWVLVPEEPIEPGGVEITLAESGKEGRADQSFVVVVDPDKTSQPLVVASEPGEATEVLQGLERPEEEMAVASLDADEPASQPEAEPAQASEPATQAEETSSNVEEPAQADSEPSEPQPAAPSNNIAPAEPQTEADAAEEPAAPGSQAEPAEAAAGAEESETADVEPPAASSTDQPSIAVVTEPAEDALATASEAPAEDPPAAEISEPESPEPQPAEPAPETADSELALANADPQTEAEPDTAFTGAQPTIDAIEIDDASTFFAGSGEEGATIRLYVDDTFVADAVVEGGRWLVEAGDILTDTQHRVRIDMLEPGSAEVVARAEVNFVVDLPETEDAIAVAEAPAAEPAAPAPAGEAIASAPDASPDEPSVTESTEEPAAPTPPTEPTEPPTPSVPESTVPQTAPAPATSAEPPTEPEPSAPANESVTEPATEQPAVPEDAQTSMQTTEPEPAPSSEPQSPAEPAPVAEPETQIAESGASAAGPETTPEEPEVPTLVATPVGDPEMERFSAGRAIIRRGDNLWTIARRVYGRGIEYTTIYEANASQIRDPDRIYPGQVFDLPDQAD